MTDLLATTRGRLLAFFLLYVTEGIPQGFTSVALAYQMRVAGLSPAQIGTFVASLYLPWSWKVLVGPLVDLVYSERLGHRRAWIVGCQLMMSLTLLAAWPVDFATDLKLLSIIIIVHNVFAATQDVAIDALAVSVLPERERGVANGLMFAGTYTGAAVGGAGVLYLAPHVGFNQTFWMVAASILVITATVSLWLRERKPPPEPVAQQPVRVEPFRPGGTLAYEPQPPPPVPEPPVRGWAYVWLLLRSMFGSLPAVAGLMFALLPAGAFAVSLTLRQNLPAEFGMAPTTIANLTLAGTLLSAAGCVAGGFISDRIGRRRAVALFVVLTTVPALLMAWQLRRHGWVMPIDTKAATRPVPPAALVSAFVWLSLGYAFVLGLIYGSRSAGFMDLSHPAVAGTQFTAYMSVMNFTLAYSSWWQGWASERFGYPMMLTIDVVLGLACLVPLAFMKPRARSTADVPPGAVPSSAGPRRSPEGAEAS